MLYVGLLTTIIILGVIFKCHTFFIISLFSIVLFTPTRPGRLCSDNGRQCSEGDHGPISPHCEEQTWDTDGTETGQPVSSRQWVLTLPPCTLSWASGWETCLSANVFLWQSPWSFPPSCQETLLLCLYTLLLGDCRPGPKDWVCFSVKLLFTGLM